jgi:hypothetical protein
VRRVAQRNAGNRPDSGAAAERAGLPGSAPGGQVLG